MEGRGERVTRLPSLPQISVILVNPGVMLSTAEVFGALNARTGPGAMQPPAKSIQSLWDVVAYLEDAVNDLEAPACRLHPVIDEVYTRMKNRAACCRKCREVVPPVSDFRRAPIRAGGSGTHRSGPSALVGQSDTDRGARHRRPALEERIASTRAPRRNRRCRQGLCGSPSVRRPRAHRAPSG